MHISNFSEHDKSDKCYKAKLLITRFNGKLFLMFITWSHSKRWWQHSKFKEWSSIKQYAKNKPVEWDIVVLVLQDISTSFTCTWKRKKMQGEYRRKYSSNPNWMPWNHALKLFFFFLYNNFLIRLSIWLGLNENGEKAPRKQLLKEAWTIVITKFCFPKKWIAVNGLLCHQL